MKTARIFLIGFFICVFLSVSVSFSQTTSAKVQNFLKVIHAATSLAELRTAFDKAKFTQNEIDQLKKAILSSPTLMQKIEQLNNQARALMKSKMDQFKQQALANLDAIKSKYTLIRQQKDTSVRAASQEAAKAPPCQSDTPIIIFIQGAPIEPGVSFLLGGKGFGPSPGSIDLMFGGFTYRAIVDGWGECYAVARLTPEISGVRPSNYATLVLRTAGGKETNKITSFQPILEFNDLYNVGSLSWVSGSNDWILNDFQLKNDWFVSSRDFKYWLDGGDAHTEITYASDLTVPNGSAKTGVHAGCNFFGSDGCVTWFLDTCICGPKGLSYK